MTEVAYLPDLLANTECVGSSACYVQTVESGDCTENDGDCEGTWSACDSSDSSTCTRDYGEWVGRSNLKRTNPNPIQSIPSKRALDLVMTTPQPAWTDACHVQVP